MMKFQIRNLQAHEVESVIQWYGNDPVPTPDMMPLESTFICEIDSVPALCVTLYLTNGPLAYIELFIGNPDKRGPLRREATQALVNHFEHFAREKGYTKLLCLAPNESLRRYYQRLGYTLTLDSVSALLKEL